MNDRTSSASAPRTAWRAVAAMAVLCFGDAIAQEPQPDPRRRVDAVRSSLGQWVEVRQNLAKTKRDWAVEREYLGQRADLYRQEAEALRARIAEAETSIGKADEKKQELAGENERLIAASAALAQRVQELERRTLALLQRLPDPIREKVKLVSQGIPAPGTATRLGLGQRYSFVIGVLNEVNKFAREITVTSEVKKLGNGATAEVTALYVGIARGYYVTANGDAAGVGMATADGWVWTPADEIAPQVRQAIAIVENEQVAAWVKLPIRID